MVEWNAADKCWDRTVIPKPTPGEDLELSEGPNYKPQTATTSQLKSHTRKQIKAVMNSIYSFLNFTLEDEEEYEEEGGYIPTLDMACKMLPTGEVTYKYFEKTNGK